MQTSVLLKIRVGLKLSKDTISKWLTLCDFCFYRIFGRYTILS